MILSHELYQHSSHVKYNFLTSYNESNNFPYQTNHILIFKILYKPWVVFSSYSHYIYL